MPRGLVCKDGVWAEVDINSENIGADHQRGIFRWQIISIEHETPDVRHYAALVGQIHTIYRSFSVTPYSMSDGNKIIRRFIGNIRDVVIYAIDATGTLVDCNPRTLLYPALADGDFCESLVIHGNTSGPLNLSHMRVFGDMIYRRSQYAFAWQRDIRIVSTMGMLYFTVYTNDHVIPSSYADDRYHENDSPTRIRQQLLAAWGLDVVPSSLYPDSYVYITYVVGGCTEDITRAPGVSGMLTHLLHDDDAMVLESNSMA